jgi:hypothetical protein
MMIDLIKFVPRPPSKNTPSEERRGKEERRRELVKLVGGRNW